MKDFNCSLIRRAGLAALALITALIPVRLANAGPVAPPSITIGSNVQRSDTVVKVATRPRYRGGATLVHEVTIGATGGSGANTADEYNLTSVGDVLVARDGSVILVDRGTGFRGTPFVRQYDARGKYVRTLGAKGQGPGEYESPSGLGQLPDGRILIRDGAQRRINVYSPTGQPIDTWQLGDGLRIFSAGNHLLVDTAGIIYRREHTRPSTREERSPPFGLVRMRSDETVIDTLPPPELPDVGFPMMQASTQDGRGGRSAYLPYAPSTVWAWSPFGYAITGRTDRYAIDLRIPRQRTASSPSGKPAPAVWKSGDPVISIRRDVRPVAISDEERRARRSATEAFFRAVDPKWSWSGPDIPRVKPYFTRIATGQDGRIWVTVSVPSERFTPEPTTNVTGRTDGGVPFREPLVYDVFEPDGTYLGQVALPERTRLVAMTGDRVWLVVRDADDVQTVQQFRIAWK